MAELAPFKGVLFNTQKISELADVVTPPYDVITPEEQDEFYRSHPNNIIRLILGKKESNDTPKDNPHTRAAQYFSQWLSEGTLQQDKTPCLYLKSIEFEWDHRQYIRYGLITLVRLEPFEKGVVLPHEQTFSRVKSERLDLIKACNTNFDPVFALFADNDDMLRQLVLKTTCQTPDLDFSDRFKQRHRLWRITNPDTQKFVIKSLAPESLFIADGHHRYETALNYRNWLKEKTDSFPSDHPANFVMMYLSSMKDPGLIILPAHRLLRQVTDAMITATLAKAKDFFELTPFPFTPETKKQVQAEFMAQLQEKNTQNAIGLIHKGQSLFYILTLRPGVMNTVFADSIPSTLKELDVTVLTRLIFMKLLGFDQKRLDDEQLIGYNSQTDKSINSIISGEYDVAFILNPTHIEQVRSVALNHLTMPRKSTYFYPKVVSGIVQNVLTP